MAEGFVNHIGGSSLEAKSAGVEPSSLNPLAVQVMKEAGIDISGHTVNRPEDFADIDFDYLITLCDHARETCPLFLSEKPIERLHWGFPDPAIFEGSEEEKLNFFRQVRDEIFEKITGFWTELPRCG
jgi:arsenate reductase